MASEILSNVKSFKASEAIGAYIAVTKDGITDNIKIAGAGDTVIGATIANVALGESVGVRLFNAGGTAFLKVGGIIAKNAAVRVSANGKGLATGTGAILGSAEVAGLADGDIIELLIGVPGGAPAAGAALAAVAAATYVAPNAGVANSGDATTDTVITSLRTELIALAADVAAHKTFIDALRTALIAKGVITGAA